MHRADYSTRSDTDGWLRVYAVCREYCVAVRSPSFEIHSKAFFVDKLKADVSQSRVKIWTQTGG